MPPPATRAFALLVVLSGCGGGGANEVDSSSDARPIDAPADAGTVDAPADGASVDGPADAPVDGGWVDAGMLDSGAAADLGGAADLGEPPPDGAVTYATDFNGTEGPISEGGAWSHAGLDWTLVETAGGIAYGTQTGTGGYDDSYALLSGFPPDQSASGVIHLDPAIDGNCTHEVEILLRWADAAHDAHGYECNLAFDGSYAQIVRWNGPLGDFTYVGTGSVPGGVNDGDTLSASIVGDQITLSVNGMVVATATDSTWTTGNPGIGFWRGGACGTTGDYGFTSYAATSVGP